MEQDVLIALLSLAGTLTGTLGGILTSARLTNYRIEQLEKKVDRHNGFGERITVTLTGVFAALALQRCVSAQEFLTVFTVVISFYFGTQHERSNAA